MTSYRISFERTSRTFILRSFFMAIHVFFLRFWLICENDRDRFRGPISFFTHVFAGFFFIFFYFAVNNHIITLAITLFGCSITQASVRENKFF